MLILLMLPCEQGYYHNAAQAHAELNLQLPNMMLLLCLGAHVSSMGLC